MDTRLLYSKYPPNEGLVVVAFYQRLFQEALSLRNQIVAQELSVADDGMEEALGRLHPDTLNTNGKQDRFYLEYLHPQIERVTSILHQLNPLEKAYFTTMMTFVYREQRVSKLGLHEGVTTCFADLWNMPLNEKIETLNQRETTEQINKNIQVVARIQGYITRREHEAAIILMEQLLGFLQSLNCNPTTEDAVIKTLKEYIKRLKMDINNVRVEVADEINGTGLNYKQLTKNFTDLEDYLTYISQQNHFKNDQQ